MKGRENVKFTNVFYLGYRLKKSNKQNIVRFGCQKRGTKVGNRWVMRIEGSMFFQKPNPAVVEAAIIKGFFPKKNPSCNQMMAQDGKCTRQ